jgi:hypothetical protein
MEDLLVDGEDKLLDRLIADGDESAKKDEGPRIKTEREDLNQRLEESVLFVAVAIYDLSNVIDNGCLTYSNNSIGNDEGNRSEPNTE